MSSIRAYLSTAIPEEMDSYLEGLIRGVLKHQPEDINMFAMQYFQSLVDIRKQKGDDKPPQKSGDNYPLIISVKNKNLRRMASEHGSIAETREISDGKESSPGEETNLTCSELNSLSLTRDDCLSLPDKSLTSLTFQQSPGTRNVPSSCEKTPDTSQQQSDGHKKEFSSLELPLTSASEPSDVKMSSLSEIHTELDISSVSTLDEAQNNADIEKKEETSPLMSIADSVEEKNVEGRDQMPEKKETIPAKDFSSGACSVENASGSKSDDQEVLDERKSNKDEEIDPETNSIENIEKSNELGLETHFDETAESIANDEECDDLKEDLNLDEREDNQDKVVDTPAECIVSTDTETKLVEGEELLISKPDELVSENMVSPQDIGNVTNETTLCEINTDIGSIDEMRVDTKATDIATDDDNVVGGVELFEITPLEKNTGTSALEITSFGDSQLMKPLETSQNYENLKDSSDKEESSGDFRDLKVLDPDTDSVPMEMSRSKPVAIDSDGKLKDLEVSKNVHKKEEENEAGLELEKRISKDFPSEHSYFDSTKGMEDLSTTIDPGTKITPKNQIIVEEKTLEVLSQDEKIETKDVVNDPGESIILDVEEEKEVGILEKVTPDDKEPLVKEILVVDAKDDHSDKKVDATESKTDTVILQGEKSQIDIDPDCFSVEETEKACLSKSIDDASDVVTISEVTDEINETSLPKVAFAEVKENSFAGVMEDIHEPTDTLDSVSICEKNIETPDTLKEKAMKELQKSIDFDEMIEQIKPPDHVEEIEELKIFHEILSCAFATDSLNLDSGQSESNNTLSSEAIPKSDILITSTDDTKEKVIEEEVDTVDDDQVNTESPPEGDQIPLITHSPIMISKVIEIKQVDEISDEESLQHVQASEVTDEETEGLNLLKGGIPFKPVIITKVVEARIVGGPEVLNIPQETQESTMDVSVTEEETVSILLEEPTVNNDDEMERLSKVSTGSHDTICEELNEESQLSDRELSNPVEPADAVVIVKEMADENLTSTPSDTELPEDDVTSTPIRKDLVEDSTVTPVIEHSVERNSTSTPFEKEFLEEKSTSLPIDKELTEDNSISSSTDKIILGDIYSMSLDKELVEGSSSVPTNDKELGEENLTAKPAIDEKLPDDKPMETKYDKDLAEESSIPELIEKELTDPKSDCLPIDQEIPQDNSISEPNNKTLPEDNSISTPIDDVLVDVDSTEATILSQPSAEEIEIFKILTSFDLTEDGLRSTSGMLTIYF